MTAPVYIVVTRGREACPHTRGSAVPKGWIAYPGFETLSFSEAVSKARKVGRPVVRSRRPTSIS